MITFHVNIETDYFLLLCKRNKMEKTQRRLFMFTFGML